LGKWARKKLAMRWLASMASGRAELYQKAWGESVKDDEVGVDAGAEVGAVEIGGAAEEGVANDRDEESRREAV
jgi:hypothetical protein